MENKYEITEEMLLRIEKTSPYSISRELKECYPEVFKKELEVGRWYKRPHNKALFKVLSEPDETGRFEVYGFDTDGIWMTSDKCYTFLDNDRKATQKEVTGALAKEAFRRYKKGDYIGLSDVFYRDVKNNMIFGGIDFKLDSGNLLLVKSTNNYWIPLMNNGTWATIMPTKTKEEAEKELNCKIV